MSDYLAPSAMHKPLDINYDLVAEDINAIIAKYPIFRSSVEITHEEFIKVLPEAAQQYFRCRCCSNFFTHMSNTVYYDADSKWFKSVIFDSIIKQLEEPIAGQVKAMADKIIAGKIESFFYIAEKDFKDFAKKGTVGTRVSLKGWPHFWSKIPNHDRENYQFNARTASDNFTAAYSVAVNWIGTYKPEPILKAVKEVLIWAENSKVNKKHVHAVSVIYEALHTIIAADNIKVGLAILATSNEQAYLQMRTLSTSVIGSLIGEIANANEHGHDKDRCFNNYFKRIDPEAYRVKVALDDEKAIADAAAKVVEMGYGNSFNLRFAKLEEMSAIRLFTSTDEVLAASAPKAETENGEPVKPLNVFEAFLAEKKEKDEKAATEKEIVKPTVKVTIGWLDFINQIVPKALSMKIKFQHTGHYTSIVVQADPESKKFHNMPQDYLSLWNIHPIRLENHGLSPDVYYPVHAIAPSCWTIQNEKGEWIADAVGREPAFTIQVMGGNNDTYKTSGIRDIESIACNDLYQYRAAIKSLITDTTIDPAPWRHVGTTFGAEVSVRYASLIADMGDHFKDITISHVRCL